MIRCPVNKPLLYNIASPVTFLFDIPMPDSFVLHPQLQHDCISLGHFPLCRLLLLNTHYFPWFILVPQRPHLRESFELNYADRLQLNEESTYLAKTLAQTYHADKMNIASIGNIVPQLHIHHVVRYTTDSAWPAPVWGFAPLAAYSAEQINAHKNLLQKTLIHDQFTHDLTRELPLAQ